MEMFGPLVLAYSFGRVEVWKPGLLSQGQETHLPVFYVISKANQELQFLDVLCNLRLNFNLNIALDHKQAFIFP